MPKQTRTPDSRIRATGGRQGPGARRPQQLLSQLIQLLLVGSGVLPAYALDLNALPGGGQLAAGAATISQSGSQMVVNQASERAVINWSSFNIGANALVNFAQPNASSVVLNRVNTSAGASEIQGQLTANGQVFLINPNGVLFGKTAQVNVGGLVASTLNLTDANFLAGHYTFNNGGAAGSIDNQGVLRSAEGGYIALLAPEVRNQGIVAAHLGTAALAGGDRVTLDFAGDRLVSLAVNQPALKALVENKHLIQADGGTVILAARSASDIAATVVNNEGLIRAASVSEHNGVIRLEGGERGSVAVSGTLDASGRNAGETGGMVKVLGDKVGLFAGAKIDASGDAGGGSVLVGGNFQGKGPEQNAGFTFINRDAQINADALTKGNGGKIIVWSDYMTRYYGGISARGGALAGNGGDVEVSGRENLDFIGRVDVAAPHGMGGRVLLDPEDIVLNATVQASPPNNVNGTPDVAFADPPDPGTTTIQITDITGYSELYLQATRDITVSSALTMAAGNSMRFEANNNININAALITTGAGIINLKADADTSGAGTLALAAAGTLASDAGGIVLSGASVTSAAGATINSTGGANGVGGDVSITASGAINLAAAITSSGGAAGVGNPGRNAGNVALTSTAGTVTTTTITASGSVGNGANMVGGNGGNITVNSSGAISMTNLAASGGNSGAGGNSAGGNAGAISITNNSAAGGTVTTGTLTARTGAAVGSAVSGAAGSISVTENAAALLQTGAISTVGQAGGAGGNVTLTSAGGVTVTSTIGTSGAALNAGTVAAGRNAGNITVRGVDRTLSAGAITASGGAAIGAANPAGNAGVVLITGTDGTSGTAGTLVTGAITASNGTGILAGASGTAGSITLEATTISGTGALTTTGGANGAGGTITGTATTGSLTVGAITSSGGAAAVGASGGNAGAVNLTSSAGAVTTTTITASGGNGNGAGTTGGNAANITVNSSGAILTTDLTSSGGNAGAGGNSAGGNAGAISVTNNSAAGGTVTTGILTARTGAAVGTVVSGAAGSISVTENSAALLQTGVIDARGQAGGAGSNVTLTSTGGITVTGILRTTGGALNVGTAAAGRNAGNITVRGVDRSLAGAITASGGAADGAGNAGGNGGAVLITGTGGTAATAGTLATTGITVANGAAVGTVASGTPGSITLGATTVTATGVLTTTGGSNGAGGAITATATTGLLNIDGAINSSGGAALASSAGSNAGNVTLSGVNVTTLGITASGSAGATALSDKPGGAGGTVQITSTGGVTTAAIAASGGAATTTNANGGNAGSIDIANSTAGNVTTTTLTAVTGAATGTGTGGTVAATAISVSNTAAGGSIGTGAINTAGGLKGAGGNVMIASAGDVTVGGTIATGAIALTGTMAGPGRNAGNVTIKGVNRSVTGAITASGGAAIVAGDGGGNGGTVLISGTDGTAGTAGTLSTVAITASTGNALTTGAGGTAGSITLGGTTVAATTLTTTGGANGAGGAITATATTGLLNVTGAITATGGAAAAGAAGANAGNVTLTGDSVTTVGITANGTNGNGANLAGGAGGNVSVTGSANAVSIGAISTIGGNGTAGNANGGNAGTITLDAGATTPTITLAGNLTATGGTLFGAGSGGNGGKIWLKDPALINLATLTAATTSGGAGGTGADVQFDGTINSTGGARAMVVNTTANTIFNGAVGGSSALSTLTTNVGGTTKIDGGGITTSGTQTYNDAVTVGATASLVSTGGTVSVVSTLGAGANALTVTADTITFGGGAGSVSGTSTLALQPTASGVTVGVNGGAGTLQVSAADITALAGGFSGITIGRADGTATATVSAVTFVDPVTIQQGGAGGAITVNGLITGTGDASVALTAPGGIALNGVGVTTANQNVTLTGPVSLATGAVAINAGSGDASFSSTINGAQTLTVNSTGTTTFSGAIGGTTALTSLTTNAGGTTALNGAVTTTGAQLYSDAVTLGAATTLNAGAGSITFSGTVNGGFDLAANSTTATTFTGAVGDTTALTSLTTNAAGTTAVNGGAVTTTGAQTYNDAVTLGATTALGSSTGTVTLASTLGAGANALTVTANGIDFTGGAGSVSGTSSITLQPATNGVSIGLGGGVGTLQLTTADIGALANGFSGITIGRAGGTDTTVVGAVSFADPVSIQQGGGSGVVLVNGLLTGTGDASVTLTAANVIFDGAGVTTANQNVSMVGPVTLSTGAVAFNAGAGNVSFSSTINGAQALTVNNTGTTTFTGAVGNTTPLASLTTNALGTTLINGGSIATTGDQTYSDAVTTNGATSLNASTGALTATGVVTATAGTLTLTADATKDISFANVANDFGTVAIPGGKNATLKDTNALTLGNASVAGNILAVAGGGLTLAGTLTTSAAAGTSIQLSGQSFTNSAGGAALAPGAGSRFLVWSSNANPFGGGTPDSRGGLAYDFKQYNATYGVTAVAQAAGNGFLYTLAPTVTPGLTGTVSKVYDGLTTATLAPGHYTTSGAVDGDTVTLDNPVAGTYDNATAGTGKTVTVPVIALSSASNGAATVYGYQLAATSANANIGTITAAGVSPGFSTTSVTPGVTAANKVYDGTTTATITSRTLTGVIGADDVHLVGGTAVFDDKNVGIGKTVTAYGLSLSGAAAGNYTASSTATTTANITPAPLTLAATAANKTYDGNNLATVTGYGLAGFVGTERLSASSTGATFSDKNVGTGKLVTITGISLSNGANGGLATNYSVPGTTLTTANITPASLGIILTAGITAANKVYDGTTAATITGRTLIGVKDADDVTLTGGTATFDNKNVGTGKTVTAVGLGLSGAAAGNYTSNTTATTTADITKAPLTLAATAANKTYDGTNLATVTGYGLAGFVGSETVSASSTGATFSDKNAGTGKMVTINGISLSNGANGGLASNYSVPASTTTAADIMPAVVVPIIVPVVVPTSLTAGVTAANKVYDGTATAFITSRVLLGVIGTDNVILTGGTATFDNKNVGVGKTVTAVDLRLSGAAASNYTANTTATTTADITPASLTVSGLSASNKVYDATTTASLTGTLVLNGVIGSDIVKLNNSAPVAFFADKNVGTAKQVSVSGIYLSGADVSNYTLTPPASMTADITPASLSASIVGNPTKSYDGNQAATLGAGNIRITGLVGTESLTVAQDSGRYDSKDAGARIVTASLANENFTPGVGTQLGNYTLPTVASGAGTIVPADLRITAEDMNKQAGTANPPFSVSYSGFKLDDSPGSLSGSLVFNTPATTASQAGSYPIKPSGLTASNYSIDYVDGTLTVTPPASPTSSGTEPVISSILTPAPPIAAAPVGGVNINTLPAKATDIATLNMATRVGGGVSNTQPVKATDVTTQGRFEPSTDDQIKRAGTSSSMVYLQANRVGTPISTVAQQIAKGREEIRVSPTISALACGINGPDMCR